MDEVEKLVRHIAIANVTILGYMMFVNDHKMQKEASTYVQGLLAQFTDEDWLKMFEQTRKDLLLHEQASVNNDTAGSTEK